jgi:flagellar hook-length control protein FliK
VREISVVVNPSGNQQVHIEMNSQVLKGLHIQIERNQGTIAIQFQSNSAQVTDLLQKNVAVLSQALSDKGMSQPTIRVSGPAESNSAGDYKSQSQPSGRGQGGRRGGGR